MALQLLHIGPLWVLLSWVCFTTIPAVFCEVDNELWGACEVTLYVLSGNETSEIKYCEACYLTDELLNKIKANSSKQSQCFEKKRNVEGIPETGLNFTDGVYLVRHGINDIESIRRELLLKSSNENPAFLFIVIEGIHKDHSESYKDTGSFQGEYPIFLFRSNQLFQSQDIFREPTKYPQIQVVPIYVEKEPGWFTFRVVEVVSRVLLYIVIITSCCYIRRRDRRRHREALLHPDEPQSSFLKLPFIRLNTLAIVFITCSIGMLSLISYLGKASRHPEYMFIWHLFYIAALSISLTLHFSRIVAKQRKMIEHWSERKIRAVIIVPATICGLILGSYYTIYRNENHAMITGVFLTISIIYALILHLSFTGLFAILSFIVTVLCVNIASILMLFYGDEPAGNMPEMSVEGKHAILLNGKGFRSGVRHAFQNKTNGQKLIDEPDNIVLNPFGIHVSYDGETFLCPVRRVFYFYVWHFVAAGSITLFGFDYYQQGREENQKRSKTYIVVLITSSVVGFIADSIIHQYISLFYLFSTKLPLLAISLAARKKGQFKTLFIGFVDDYDDYGELKPKTKDPCGDKKSSFISVYCDFETPYNENRFHEVRSLKTKNFKQLRKISSAPGALSRMVMNKDYQQSDFDFYNFGVSRSVFYSHFDPHDVYHPNHHDHDEHSVITFY